MTPKFDETLEQVPEPAGADNSLLLVVPVPVRMVNGRLMLESQSAHALDQYASRFDKITFLAPLIPESRSPDSSMTWVPVDAIEYNDKITVVPLPWAYAPLDHWRQRRSVIRILDACIPRHDYIQVALGGMFGDWGGLAALRAKAHRRACAVWADRIEHRVIAHTQSETFAQKAKNFFTLPFIRHFEQKVVRAGAVCLFNGYETYSYYARFNANSHQVHDIHTRESQYISNALLARKLICMAQRAPLKICYMGRLDPMKAPFEWLDAIHRIDQAGVEFEATWLGGGDLLDEVRQKCQALGLQGKVHMPGFVADHERVLRVMQESDLMLFTHVTPESPRCLIESLVSGTLIAGYESAYSRNLVAEHGGGRLVPVHNSKALAQQIIELDRDRESLQTLTRQAAANGRRFSDTAAFTERCDLIRRFAGHNKAHASDASPLSQCKTVV